MNIQTRHCFTTLLLTVLLSAGVTAQTTQGDLGDRVMQGIQDYPDIVHYRAAVRSYKDGFNTHAREQFQLAAGWGNKEAQFNLALMHFAGIGVTVDRVKGAAWALLADERGDGRFRKTRREIMGLLAPEEKQAALDLARELKNDFGDFQALEKRAKWVRKQKRELTGSRTGSLASAVRITTVGGRFAGRGDEYLGYLNTFEQQLLDVVTSVEYKDFEVLDEDPEAAATSDADDKGLEEAEDPDSQN
ncbi:MAG: hypothetical protein AAF552_00225 [Pseudomonadota bacterium]